MSERTACGLSWTVGERKVYPSDLTDEQRAVVGPIFTLSNMTTDRA